MRQRLWTLWREEDGQDLIEYTLLLVFIVCITAGLFGFGGNSISAIVSVSNNSLARGSQIAAGS
jgi:Flp pilus assembly pilin Flp